MVTLHEVITFLVSMQISISSLQTHNVNRCGRSRHLARKLSLRRKRSSPNVFEMAATETITSIILIKLIRVSLGTVRHPRRFKIVVIDIQITLKQMLRDFIGIRESTARVASIMENTNLSKQQQVSEIMRQMLTQAQTAGQYFTNDQIKEMTRKVSAEVDLVHQQTQNQRYGSSHIGATAKDISNVVTDAASGVVDIFHGIDKAVADTWNNFWKDGKADGIGSNLSRK